MWDFGIVSVLICTRYYRVGVHTLFKYESLLAQKTFSQETAVGFAISSLGAARLFC